MLFSQAESFAAALVSMMFSRVGMAVTTVLNNAQLLRHTPDQYRGRVFATMESLRWSVMIVSMAAAGIASQYASPRTIGLVAGAFGLLTATRVGLVRLGAGPCPRPGVGGPPPPAGRTQHDRDRPVHSTRDVPTVPTGNHRSGR